MTDKSISITANGDSITVHTGCTLTEFLTSKELQLEHVVVERNRKALSKSEAGSTVLENEDVLEIVRIVAGG